MTNKNKNEYFSKKQQISKNIIKAIKSYIGEVVQVFVFLLITLFVISPVIICILVSFNPTSIVFPPDGFSLEWYSIFFKHEVFINATKNSFIVAIITTLISPIIGTLGAFALTRYDFKGKGILTSLFLSPIFIPAILLGLGLHSMVIALQLYKSFAILIIGHILITIPYSTRTVTAVLQTFVDHSMEEAAMNIGATPLQVFFKITLPLIKAGIFAGMIFTFIMSWNDFVMSIFLVGPRTFTLPLQIAAYVAHEYKPILAAISTLSIIFSGIAIFVIERTIGISSIRQ